jgi:hypothetical protein
MIPTFRSMIVAMLLTLIALVGGFGLFAAFRVNHEPLARLPASATPFALANNDAPPQALSFASEPPFGSRLENNAALVAISVVSTAGHNADPPETIQPPSVAAAPDSASADNTLATTAAVDTKPDDAPPPAVLAEADPKADDAAPLVAAVEPQPNAASVEPQQPDSTAMPRIAAVEAQSDAQPSDQRPSERASDAAAVTASAAENSQPETTPSATDPTDDASTAAPAPVMTAAVTPTAPVTAARADEQDTAKEMARRKRIAAVRRGRRARALAAAQLASQNSLFPQASFQSTSQITYQPAQQQAVGGPFVPAPAAASAKARRQN